MNDNSRLSCQVPKRSCFYIDLPITTHLVPQLVCPLVPKARVNPAYSPPPLGHTALVTVDVCDASQVVTPQSSLQNCNVMWLGPQAHSFFLYSNSRRWMCQKMLPAKTPAPIPFPLTASPTAESRLLDTSPDPVPRTSRPSGLPGFICHLDSLNPS